MDIFNQMFIRSKISPLQRNYDIGYEVEYHTNLITNKGLEIISNIQNEEFKLILYRHFYEDTPKDKEKTIILGIRVITMKGILYPDPVLKAFFNDDFTEISLADIDIEEYLSNHGFGSILLTTLIEIAKNRKINSICGWISNVDIDHIERLVHFYKKHNFEVILDSNNKDSLKVGNLRWQRK